MANDIENAYAFGALLRENAKAGASWESSSPQQKECILLKVASASPGDLPIIVSGLEDSAR